MWFGIEVCLLMHASTSPTCSGAAYMLHLLVLPSGICTVFALNEDCNSWHKIVLDSGSFDTWVVPDSGKQILSLMRLIRQGHRPHLHGAHPGLHVAGTQLYLPLVSGSSADKTFLYLPCYPPPSRSNLIANNQGPGR